MKIRMHYLVIACSLLKLSLLSNEADRIKILQNKATPKKATINDIPPEIFEHIISFVPSKDRHCLKTVSKRFFNAVGIKTLRLDLEKKPQSSFSGALELHEKIQRALVVLEGNTHKVKHIVIRGKVLLAIPSELRSFTKLENITFDGIDLIFSEKYIKDMQTPLFSVRTARKEFPNLKCIAWINIINSFNSSEAITYTLETQENFELFEKKVEYIPIIAEHISLLFSDLKIKPSKISTIDVDSGSLQPMPHQLNISALQNAPVSQRESFSRRFLNNLLLITVLSRTSADA